MKKYSHLYDIFMGAALGAAFAGIVAWATPAAAESIRDDFASPPDSRDYGEFSRHVNGTTGYLGILLKTYVTDPILRPLSTLRSLGFVLTNTFADLTSHTVIDMVRMPALSDDPIPSVADGPGMDLEAWETELDRITGTTRRRGELEFLVDGGEYFPALIDGIENATESIHLRTYIFDNDDFAVGIADRLRRRSQQIDVRVSMDGIGTHTGGLVHSETMPANFEPPASIHRYLRQDSNVRARTLTNPWLTGDHTKLTLIDRRIAFIGGMNVGREYRFDWHDLMVRVTGDVVATLAKDADDAWAKSGPLGDLAAAIRYFTPTPAGTDEAGYPVRVLQTRVQDSQIYRAKLAAIRRAKSRIYVENPYFSDDAILYELVAARRRGVDVRFVIAERGDATLMDMSNAQTINTMLANGIRVYMYPGMTHVKAMIVDGWLMVGSANLDKLSLRVNNELNIATSHPAAVQALEQRLFEADFRASEELDTALPTSPEYQLAEAVADIFL